MASKRSKAGHQVYVPEAVWDAARALDPLGRSNAGPYIRERLSQLFLSEGPPPDETETVRVSPPKPKPKPLVKPPVDYVLDKRTSSDFVGRSNEWFVSISRRQELDRLARTCTVTLELAERGRRLWRVKYNPKDLYLTDVNARDGLPYYVLDVDTCSSHVSPVKETVNGRY